MMDGTAPACRSWMPLGSFGPPSAHKTAKFSEARATLTRSLLHWHQDRQYHRIRTVRRPPQPFHDVFLRLDLDAHVAEEPSQVRPRDHRHPPHNPRPRRFERLALAFPCSNGYREHQIVVGALAQAQMSRSRQA